MLTMFFFVFQTGIPEPLMTGFTKVEDEQLKNMLRRLNTVVEVM